MGGGKRSRLSRSWPTGLSRCPCGARCCGATRPGTTRCGRPGEGEGAGSGERVRGVPHPGRARPWERGAGGESAEVRAGARGASSSSAVCPAGSGVVRASEDCERAGCGIPEVGLRLHIGRGGTITPRLGEKDEMPRESRVSDHLRRVCVKKCS